MQLDPSVLTGGVASVIGVLVAATRLVGAIKGAATEVKTLVGAVGLNTDETRNLAGEFKAYREQTTSQLGALDKRVAALEGTVPQWPARL